MSDESIFDTIDSVSQSLKEAEAAFEKESLAWWDALSEEEREKAFYAVVKKIYLNDVELGGSYRYGLYTIFGFDPGMYGLAMSCGYLEIHNLIQEGLESKERRLGWQKA